MLFDPQLILETAASKKTNQKFTLYKSWSEYIVCDIFERDHYVKLGYRINPREFLEESQQEMDRNKAELAKISEEIETLTAKKRKKRTKTVEVEMTEQELFEDVTPEE